METMSQDQRIELQNIANQVRKDVITMIHNSKSGHVGSALSIVDILTYLYYKAMRVAPANPKWQKRDRLVLSKGHASSALYSILSMKGFFSRNELEKFRKIDSFLQGHPDARKVPGVDASTGSLGQGASVACGMALASKIGELKYDVYTILGDGELQEGQVWESMMFAAHHNLDNLLYIIDNNNLQIDDNVEKVINIYPLEEKFKSFGFKVWTLNAHDFNQIKDAVDYFKCSKGRPMAIIAKSIKGKGVSFMENNPDWHSGITTEEEYKIALAELGKLS